MEHRVKPGLQSLCLSVLDAKNAGMSHHAQILIFNFNFIFFLPLLFPFPNFLKLFLYVQLDQFSLSLVSSSFSYIFLSNFSLFSSFVVVFLLILSLAGSSLSSLHLIFLFQLFFSLLFPLSLCSSVTH
jgi:hypothetical protein